MHAIILAAGKGTRLRPLTDVTPKPLVDVCDKPLLVYVLDALPKTITHITIVVGYLGEQIEKYIGNAYRSIPVRYVVQEKLEGTGAALELLRRDIFQATLVVNADDIYAKEDLARLAQFPLALLARRTKDAVANPLAVNNAHLLQGFLAKTDALADETHWQNCGAYMIDERYFLEHLVEVPVHNGKEKSLPHTLAALAQKEKVHVVEAISWTPVGTPQELAHAQSLFCS